MKTSFHLLFIGLIVAIVASCAKPTSESIKGAIKPGDRIGEMTIEREESKHYYHLLDACDFDWTIATPHSQTVECTVPELAVVGVGDFWGAEKTKIESNWEAMSWELYIDDYQITLDDFGWSDISYLDPGSGMDVTYRYWNVLLRNLSAGRHTIRSSWSQKISMNDGWNTYPPGKYEYIAELTVTEKPVYPVMPSVAEPGQHAYTSQQANLDFLLYVPENYGKDTASQYPLIIYLHDAELRGTNPDFLRKESLHKKLETQKDFPFIVLSPSGNGEWDFWSKDETISALFMVLSEIQSLYSVDENHIYLTGAGMGGNGVWAIGLGYPGYFAALAPFGGYIYPLEVPENICDLKDVPVWAFHGGSDFMVPAEVEQNLVDALNACGGAAQITVKSDAVIPLDEYYNPKLYDWLLQQTRK